MHSIEVSAKVDAAFEALDAAAAAIAVFDFDHLTYSTSDQLLSMPLKTVVPSCVSAYSRVAV
jgi:hypothetical protein